MSAIKINGQWKTPSVVYAKVEGQWKIVGQAYSKVDGLWRQTTFASPPARPVMQYVSTGVFQITGYNSSLVYEAQFVNGSGSASLNTSNGRYTLNGVNSAFNVVARYGVGAPASEAGYMERKARTSKYVQTGENCYGTNCVPNRVATCNDAPGTDSDCCDRCPAPSYDGQNRCICWNLGQPDPLCYGQQCDPIFGYVDDTKWGGSPYFYTDRGSEWSKQS